MLSVNKIVLVTGVMVAFLNAATTFAQDQNSATERANAAAKKIADKQKHKLQYKFKPGEEIRWNVEHVATTKAQIAGTKETTSSRTQSTKLWKVSNVDTVGNITFVHSVESTALWQKIGENEPLAYDSKKDTEVPDEFASASSMIGKPLAVVTISPNGEVVDRKSETMQMSFGVGDVCIPLPEEPVSVGHKWFVPTVFDATDEDGKRLKLKARINYEFNKIVTGQLAVISFRTEVLTPIESDQVRSQLLQKLNQGYVAFDMKNGRIDTKEVRWNETVQAYAGPDSHLQYNGRMTEKIVASDGKSKDRMSSARQNIKRLGDKPIIRN